jgi:hypothetical protein
MNCPKLGLDWKYIANLVKLPDVQVRDNLLVDGRMVTYTSTVKPEWIYLPRHRRTITLMSLKLRGLSRLTKLNSYLH